MDEHRPVVLFVDGDSLWTRPVRSELRRRGAAVWSLGPSDSLPNALDGRPPDLIVLRDGLKNGLGDPLEPRLRERWPDAQILRVAPPYPSAPAPDPGHRVLPAARETLLAAILDALPGRLRAPRRKRTAPLVLCVDDDRFYLDALSRILTRHGYRTAAFEDGERAIEAFPVIRPDLAILDVMMPGMDGLDLAEELRELTHDRLPVIFLTARMSDSDIVRGYEHGASYYITKPCEPGKVLNIVDYFVGELEPGERKLLETQL